MPEGNNQSISGDGNIGLSDISGSHINITNNYGLPYAHQPFSQQDPFLSSLEGYSYRQNPLPELYMVNCDRHDELNRLVEHKNSGTRHQFYFLISCPDQHPISLTQRFVFHIIQDDENSTSIQYTRTNEYEGTRRIHVRLFEPEYGTEWLQKTWLEQLQKSEYAFSTFVENELPKLPFKYIISAFELTPLDWHPSNLESILKNWLDDFSKASCNGPQCLFFFIFTVKHVHKNQNLEANESDIIDFIKTLNQAYPNHSILIDGLLPVPLKFVDSWLGKILDGINPIKLFEQWIEAKTSQCVATAHEISLDMRVIHTFQREVWQHGQKRIGNQKK